MRVEARITNPGAAQRVIVGALERETRVRLAEAGREMARVANQEMAAKFNMNRPGGRRRSPGTRRAAGSIDYQMDGSSFPMTLRYRVLGGDDVVRRVTILNFGSRGHSITPSGAWQNSWKSLPPDSASGFRRNRRSPVLAWKDEGGWRAQASVNHPGQRNPGRFLEKGVEAALRVMR